MTHGEASFEDLLNTAEAKDFLHRAEREMLPQMKASAISLVIAPDDPHGDIKLCVEIGAAVLFDKPLLVLIQPGRAIAPGLRRIAAQVLELDIAAPDAQAKLKAAVEQMLGRKADA